MAIEIFKLMGSILVNNDEANKSISKTDEKAEGLGSKFLKGVGTAAKWGTAIVGAAGAGGAALFGMATKSSQVTDRIDKLSNKIGISKKGFQEWDYILGQNGMDVEKLQVGVKTLVTQMDAAAGGSKTAKDAFNKLGLSWSDGNGKLKNQEAMMNESIKALANMKNGTEKARLATQLFGKAGVEMMPMLNNGAQAIEDLRKRAHDLGLVLGDDAVNAGVVLGDTLDDVKSSFTMIGTQIGVKVMPIIQKFADWILANMPTIQDVLNGLFKGIEFFVSLVIKGVTKLGSSINDKFGWIIDKVFQMKDAFNKSMDEFDDYGQAFKSMIEVITGPIGDLPIFDEIGKIISSIKEIIYRIKNGEGIGEALRNAFEWRDSTVGNLLLELIDFIKEAFKSIKSIIETFVNNCGPILEGLKTIFFILMDYISVIWQSIGKPVFKFFMYIVNKLAEVFKTTFPVLANIFKDLCDILSNLWQSILKPVLQGVGIFLKTVLLPSFKFVFNIVSEIIKGAFSFIGVLWNTSLKPVLNGIITFIRGVFSGNWSQIWSGIKSVASGAINGIKSVVTGAWNSIKSITTTVWNGIKTAIWTPIAKAQDLLGGFVSKVKSWFSNLFPKIKLPHFKIDGEFSLMPPKVPHLDVKWNAEGGILTKPTIFGMNNGVLQGGGEAGDEAVLPIEKLSSIMADTMKKLGYGVQQQQSKGDIYVTQNITSPEYLNPSEIARITKKELRELRFQL